MPFHKLFVSAAFLLSVASPCAAQQGAFGLGARMSMVRGDVQADPAAAAQRFTGGQVRARLSPRTTIELALDRRTQMSLDLTQRVRDYPLQGSVMLYPVHSTFSPFVLGGVGWYTHIVDNMAAGTVLDSVSSRKMGYHAGAGAEMKLGHHAGAHADYRYTMVHFGDGTNSGAGGLVSRLTPSYDGSMWTAGVTFYF